MCVSEFSNSYPFSPARGRRWREAPDEGAGFGMERGISEGVSF